MCRPEPSVEERMPAATGKGALAAWLRWVGSRLRPVAAHEGISAGLTQSRLLRRTSLESELRPQPLSPCQGETLVQ